MNYLQQKRILVGVTGGIAAYKSAELVRRLQDQGCDVRVVMTANAQQFIGSLTFQALSGHPVHTDLLDPAAEAAMGHIELARWADIIIIAPCSTNTLAKLAAGQADDLLTTLVSATDAPVAVAPAMNRLMYNNAATQTNLQALQQRGISILGPAEGQQACGETGSGRMLEPQEIIEGLIPLVATGDLSGQHILITAGPTREAIDPVRYISNYSSGRMGAALAQVAKDLGAAVTLVAGPVTIELPQVPTVSVESAAQMHAAVMQQVAHSTVFIATAAVADYRVDDIPSQKLKKNQDTLHLTLVRNADILADVAALETRPYTVGFAAETQDVLAYAEQKLIRKKLDMIAANHVGGELGFNSTDNVLEVLYRRNDQIEHQHLPQASKTQLARQLLKLIAQQVKP